MEPLFSVCYEAKGVKFCTQVPRRRMHKLLVLDFHKYLLKGVAGSADLKVNKSDPLTLNHRILLNTEPIYTK